MDMENGKKGDMGSVRGPRMSRSLHRIISEEEFGAPLMESMRPFFQVANGLLTGTGNLSAKFYFNLMNEAEKVETFLDDHGARQNQTWHYFSEVIASIRNFSIAAFELSHVLNRYSDYSTGESEEGAEEFITHGMEVSDYINSIEVNLIREVKEELGRRGCDVGHIEASPPIFREIGQKFKLPQNLESDKLETSDQRVMRIVESYRKLAIKINRERFGSKAEPDEIAKLIPGRINETKIKILENSLHNIQSEYDTHIRQTRTEAQDPNLINLRGFISIPMHLLEMARWIIHFYERHENEIHSTASRNRISEIVDKDLVLRLISQFAMYYAHRYMMAGKEVAEKVMSRFVKNTRLTVPVPKPAGFHARPAYYITLVVEEYGTDVFLYVGDRKFDARSVLSILEAGGLAADLDVEEVVFEGSEKTLQDIKRLAECNYCEDENIPRDLMYIRVARNIMT